ncbi:immunogenic protein [Rhodovibrio sodomensis]|uniref:Immunogenic protein n=1 Tax=Rhodovibrio sodomensis TaxID=1088 RepID=A0ABS1DDX2_9PROT|nr:immunogenic protein [Rhodovibrio sodomensis]
MLGALAAGAGALLLPTGLRAQGDGTQRLRFFRIGTASTAGTYYPIGGIIANAISNPPGSRSCDTGGSCGVTGMIAVVQSTEGSVDNVQLIHQGQLESGFAQADVAFWAYKGRGLFAERGPMQNLRAIANLYPEALHLVVRRDAGVLEVGDLAGKRISLDQQGSGTRVDAELILKAYGLSPDDLAEASSLPAGPAADAVRRGELDGFFFVAGTPANAVATLAAEVGVTLVPIEGEPAARLRAEYPFFAAHGIPAGTYQNVPQTPTLAVGAQWLVRAEADDDTIYEITQALWHPSTRQLLDSGHPKGSRIRLETALDGLGVPLHAGARKYYLERDLIPTE